jgi:hypothetical protein
MVSPACPPAANSHSNSRLHICNTDMASPFASQISNHERIPQSQAPHGRPHARSTVLSSSADRGRCHWPAHGRRDDLAFPRVISCSQLNCFVCCPAASLVLSSAIFALSLACDRLAAPRFPFAFPLPGPWSFEVRTDMTFALLCLQEICGSCRCSEKGITCHARVHHLRLVRQGSCSGQESS